MAPPPPQSLTLQEQQQRFLAAQHFMASRILPRQQQIQQQQPPWRPEPPTKESPHDAVDVSVVAQSASRNKRQRQQTPVRKAAKAASLVAPSQRQQKTQYAQQKELRNDLIEEARALEQQLEDLRLHAGLPTTADRQEIRQIKARNAAIEDRIYDCTRLSVQLHAQATQQLQSPPVESLATFIHMPCDQSRRREILRGMKDVKLRRAAEVGIERFRHLEANASYLSEERFTTEEDGAFHCNRWEMNAFPQFQSAKQLYDALLFWLYNMEISVTEMVDQIALREDNEEIEPTIWNHRLVIQSDDVGCVEEANMVAFARFYEGYDLMDSKPLGVIAYDTVDVDDLYPYKPLERTRKDVQSFHLINEVVDPITRKKSVVLKSCYLNAQLPPQFPVEPRVIQKLHEYMSRWAVVLVDYLRDYVVPEAEYSSDQVVTFEAWSQAPQLIERRSPLMAPPPPQLPSLQEQQQRFINAQHLMATRVVPPLQPWRSSKTLSQRQPEPQAAPHPTIGRDTRGESGVARPHDPSASRQSHGSQKRRRQPPTKASVSETMEARPKTAHEQQKEYRSNLEKEARELEQRVEQLRLHAGLPTKSDRQQLQQARRHNAEIDHHIHASMRLQVQAQALVSEQLQRLPVNPLDTFIHLPCDQTRRCAILQGMKDVKLNRAMEIGVAHFKPLEANGSYMKEERFMADDGVYHCNRWEMNEFPQFTTARQLYDALLFWLYNIEISITEMIGQLTLRENTTSDDIAPTIWNQLLITTAEGVGCTEELNVAGFAQFFPNCELLDGEPLGVIAVDTVDVDDLYPYQPHERTRKAFQAYHLMSEVVDEATGRRAAVLKSCILNSQLPPQFPVDPRVVEKLHENMSVWAVFMVQYLRDYVVPPGV